MDFPAIIDLEASGFGRGSYPIEVGVRLSDGSVHSVLIKPAAGWVHWDESAQAIHGISREHLQEQGKTVYEVALFLNELCYGQTLYSDAWSFDSSWLGRLFDEAEIVQRFKLDTLMRLLNEDELARWSDTKDATAKELALAVHRAANDVQVLSETFKKVTAG
jgi:DNA polymerase III epsilon subunit-like protein